MARRNFRTCIYVSDEGKQMLRRLDQRYQEQMNGATPAGPLLGATLPNATELGTFVNSPRDLRPRSVLVRDNTGANRARIPVFTVAAYNAIAINDALTFYDGGGTAYAGVVYGKEGERTRHKSDVA